MDFIETHKEIKTGTTIMNHPSVVELLENAHIFKSLTEIVENSVHIKELKNDQNMKLLKLIKLSKLRQKNNIID